MADHDNPEFPNEELIEAFTARYGKAGALFLHDVVRAQHEHGIEGTFVVFALPNHAIHAFSHATTEEAHAVFTVLGPPLARAAATIVEAVRDGHDVSVTVVDDEGLAAQALADAKPAGRA